MELYHIVATSRGGVIGKNNQLPWHFPADLKHFKKLTLGGTVIMGRKTFESIGEKPLPGRENFVLSRSSRATGKGGPLKFFDSLEKALAKVSTQKAFIIGGESLFKQTLNQVKGIWLTQIEGAYEGDAYYPPIPKSLFKLKTRERSKEEPKLTFLYYERR